MSSSPEKKSFGGFDFLQPVEFLNKNERSSVILAIHSISKEEFIIKGSSKTQDFIQNEIDCLTCLNKKSLTNKPHPNIIRLLDTSNDGKLVSMKLEKAPGVSLMKYIREHGALNEATTFRILEQLVSVLQFIHSKGWVHMDLKLDNMIFNPLDQSIKLIDFEYSRAWSKWSKGSQEGGNVGTLEYKAPELRTNHALKGPEVDLWALGIVLFVLLTGKLPFTQEKLRQNSESVEESIELHWPQGLNSKWQKLILGLLEKDPEQRMKLKNLKKLMKELFDEKVHPKSEQKLSSSISVTGLAERLLG